MNTLSNGVSIDLEIEHVLNGMRQMTIGSKEYQQAAESLRTLYEAKGIKNPSIISADTLISAGANLLGILLVINHERLNVLTTKAFGMVRKV